MRYIDIKLISALVILLKRFFPLPTGVEYVRIWMVFEDYLDGLLKAWLRSIVRSPHVSTEVIAGEPLHRFTASPLHRFTASSTSGYRFCKLNSSTTTCWCMRIIAVRRDYSQTFISMLCRAIYQLLAFFALGSGHKWSLTVKIRERKLGWLE